MTDKSFKSSLRPYTFKCGAQTDEAKKIAKFNAYNLWMDSIKHNQKSKLVFNPSLKHNSNHYNIILLLYNS